MKNFLIASAVLITCVSSTAMAQLSTRCFQDDQLTTLALAQGRNGWARKCGLISVSREQYLNSEGEYQVFTNGCYSYPNVPAGSTCSFYVPADEGAACIGGLVKLGTCVAGCYTPGQKVDFGGQKMTVPDAYAAGMTTVTALNKSAEVGQLSFSQQLINSYVVGDTHEDIFMLRTRDGRVIEVTSEHPMVKSDGTMVKAKTLKEGDRLMGSDGKTLWLSQVTVFSFTGKVWNVRPASKEKIENVLSAQGFLTGSVRFQNEWAEDDYRLNVRDEVGIGGL